MSQNPNYPPYGGQQQQQPGFQPYQQQPYRQQPHSYQQTPHPHSPYQSQPYPTAASAAQYQNPPYGQPPYQSQAPYQSLPYGQAPYGQPPYGQAPYGQPPHGQAPYGQAPYQQAPYGQAPYGQNPQQPPYQQPPYGQAPYGPNPYGQQPAYQPEPPPPYCPATAATAPPVDLKMSTAVNLLRNPNFESKGWSPNGDTANFKTDPWHIIETGGDGWRLERTPQGCCVKEYPADAGPYAHCVVGSNAWCKRSQIINITERGFEPNVMDQMKPLIQVYEWFIARSDCDSEYYMNVYLLDQHKKPLAEFKSGVRGAGSKEWAKVEHIFRNYPSGVRCIKFEDGTKDKPFWAGHFGAKMCQPTVKIHLDTPATPRPSSGGSSGYPGKQMMNLISNPSFMPLNWSGNTVRKFETNPWKLEKNKDGYALERQPEGAKDAQYPPELAAFDIWCLATSNMMSQRSQIIDLAQKGFTAQYLDQERPNIKIYEWFMSRTDCEGQYFLQASLLDQRRSKVPGFSYDTALKRAPVGHWHKEEHIFTNIPPGIRFVEFRDGGHDCKNWAGFYGAKMVGAFVGVMPNSSRPSQSLPPPKPKPRNLLKNENLRPRCSWNGENCHDVEFHPWIIDENGGDGVKLEKTPQGTEAGPYPPEIGPGQHCIATSSDWFRRSQTIDLIKNGYVPHMFNNPNLKIYVCEWFASRSDCEGEYYLKASLLNEEEKEIPGYTYDSDVCRAYADEWEKVEYAFFPVPDTARYVRFEDGGKDTKFWAGNFGVKMVGAAVYAGEDFGQEGEECIVM